MYRQEYIDQLKNAKPGISLDELKSLYINSQNTYYSSATLFEDYLKYANYVYNNAQISNLELGMHLFEKAFNCAQSTIELIQLLTKCYLFSEETNILKPPFIDLNNRVIDKLKLKSAQLRLNKQQQADLYSPGSFFPLAPFNSSSLQLIYYDFEDISFELLTISNQLSKNNFFDLIKLSQQMVGNNRSNLPYWKNNLESIQVMLSENENKALFLLKEDSASIVVHRNFYHIPNMLIELQWFKLAKEFYPYFFSNTATDFLRAPNLTFNYYLEHVKVVSDKNSINMPEWAFDLILALLPFTKFRHQFNSLLSNIGILQQPSLEEKLMDKLLKLNGFEVDKMEIQYLLSLGLSPSPKKLFYLNSAIEQADTSEQLFAIYDHLVASSNYSELIPVLKKKWLLQDDYYFVLFERVTDGQVSVKEFLGFIEEMPDVNFLDKYQRSLLMYSCRYGYNSIIKKLIELGADRSISSDDGYNALIASLSEIDLKYDFNKGEVEKSLIIQMIHSKVNINSLWGNSTAFTQAACDGYIDILEELIKHGATYEVMQDRGKRALEAAIYQYRTDVIKYLIQMGCDATTIKEPLSTSFHGAHREGADYTLMLDLLKEAGADV